MIEDFIGVYDNFFTSEECQLAIDAYNVLDAMGFSYERNNFKHLREDLSVSTDHLPYNNGIDYNAVSKVFSTFNEKFWNVAYLDYSKTYSILKEASPHKINNAKIQKTEKGQGYHVWHFEASNLSDSKRLMSFILYLNTIDAGGETEFLYYPRRVEPIQGRLVLFPGAYTHTHRGNTVLNGTKYIITGWVDFIE